MFMENIYCFTSGTTYKPTSEIVPQTQHQVHQRGVILKKKICLRKQKVHFLK